MTPGGSKALLRTLEALTPETREAAKNLIERTIDIADRYMELKGERSATIAGDNSLAWALATSKALDERLSEQVKLKQDARAAAEQVFRQAFETAYILALAAL